MPAQRQAIRSDRADRETTRFDRFDAHCIGSGRDDIQYVRHRSANKHLYGPISAKLCSIATFFPTEIYFYTLVHGDWSTKAVYEARRSPSEPTCEPS